MTTLGLSRLDYSPRAFLVLKLYAITAMVLDHVDTGLLDGAAGFHATWGRTVFPVFAFILAFNLERAPDPWHLLRSVAPRMTVAGLLAMPFAAYLWPAAPLNVMFTLALATVVVALARLGMVVPAVVVALALGGFVDYGWFGIAFIALGVWLRSVGLLEPVGFPLVMAALLLPINGSWWAVAAVPLLAGALHFAGDAPRLKWLFYAFYPLHLVALAAAAWFVVM